ncbi:MAG: NAD(P)-dependent oxidoreductase [Phycisphaerales bacterium]
MNPSDTTIGWIGTGVMGASMASRLLDAGFPVHLYTRTRGKAAALLERGAEWAASPRAAADKCEALFSIVGYPHDVEAVYFGDDGVFQAANPPRVVVDMTTSSPALAERLAARAAELGVHAIDAPVSGGDIGAREGTLSIMIGGDADAVESVRPILEHMGRKITRLGGPGAGQHTKMVNQILIATMMIGACEGLLYADRAGLDLDRVIEAVGGGAAGSWTINNLGPRMARRDFEPGFYIEHFIKDMNIALAEARRLGVSVPGLALSEQLYQAAKDQGLDRRGTQALLLVLERLAGIDRA